MRPNLLCRVMLRCLVSHNAMSRNCCANVPAFVQTLRISSFISSALCGQVVLANRHHSLGAPISIPVRHSAHLRRYSSRVSTIAPNANMATDQVLVAPRRGELSIVSGPELLSASGDLVVVAVWGDPAAEDSKEEDDDEDSQKEPYALPEAVARFDKDVLSGVLAEAAVDGEFRAKSNTSTDFIRVAGAPVKRVALYGLGDRQSDSAPKAAAAAAAFAVSKGISIKSCTSVSLYIDGLAAEHVAKVAEGAHLAAYTDERYKQKKKEAEKVPKKLVLLETKSIDVAAAAERGISLAAGIVTTKEVVASPANYLYPATMADAARKIAKEEGLECKVFGRQECADLKMGSFLGVAKGASSDPQFIHMIYRPPGGVAKKKLAIIGKSVCHDTGGYNLKAGPGSMIEVMKWDMGGGGTTLGVARTIGMLKPKDVEVHFIMPAVLNLISAEAYLPGDILTASNGKTIEVLNTDAEGRLCLCDALVYAENVVGDLDAIIDIATLTGACIVALGNGMAGLWSPSDALSDALLSASKGTEDKFWRMPLPDEYAEQLKSKIADLRNIGTSRMAGATTAALFLREFVKTKEWAHMDIAGTAWSDKKNGATGFGVATLVKWIESYAS